MTFAIHSQEPLLLFCAYAHEDELLRDKLEIALALLIRQGLIQVWHDRKISPGQEWQREIDRQLEAADIILLLISPDFIASDYCYSVEMQRALERDQLSQSRVIPIILRPVADWHNAPFGHLKCLPNNGKSITEWDNQDVAFRDIAQAIRSIIPEFQRHHQLMLPMQTAADDKRNLYSARCYELIHMSSSQGATRSFLPFGTLVLIGRDKQAGIRLPEEDKKASRLHCQVLWRSEDVEVFDLRSHNGTFVNDKRVYRARLRIGDRLRCGQTVFRLEDYNATESEDTSGS